MDDVKQTGDGAIPDAMPADSGTANALADAGVRPGHEIVTERSERRRIAAPEDRGPPAIAAALEVEKVWRDPDDVRNHRTSSMIASVGRIVLCFCPALWEGARPADVVGEPSYSLPETGRPPFQRVTVNVKLNGVTDAGVIAQLATHPQGQTVNDVPLFDVLTPEQREQCRENINGYPACWCEWMPYQVGQARKTEDISATLVRRVEDLAASVERLSLGTGSIDVGPIRQLTDAVRILASHCSADTRDVVVALLEGERPSLAGIADKVHKVWLDSGDRSYSPLNKPFMHLSPEQRRDIANQCRCVLDSAGVQYKDEYAAVPPPTLPCSVATGC